MKWLNDARWRSVLAGGLGGFAGWLLAEALVGSPHSLVATVTFGLFAGLGIGGCLGAAEGAFIRSRIVAQRGAIVGLVVGLVGGAIGAGFGQAGYAAAAASRGQSEQAAAPSVFSAEMSRRLQEAGAKTGDVEIALSWQNENDLDLHVIDPSGAHIYFQQRRSPSGGELDVDRNANCDAVTVKPVEHVFWPVGGAPTGQYEVRVHHYRNCGAADPTPYNVEIKADGKTQQFSGSTRFGDPPQLVTTFTRAPVNETAASPGLGTAVGRILGWLLFGALLGLAEGLVRRSAIALRNAAVGGAIGGAVGGLAFEIIARGLVPLGLSDAFCRGLGLVLLGACIGLWIVIVERAFSAVLAVRSGRLEGREIFLDRKEMRLGRNDALEVYLGFDPDIAPHHATIRREGAGHVLLQEGGVLVVNGASTARHTLHDGDAIQIGKTRLVYKHRAVAAAESAVAGKTALPRLAVPAPPPPPLKAAPLQTAPRPSIQPPTAQKAPPPMPPGVATKASGAADSRAIPPPPPPPPKRS